MRINVRSLLRLRAPVRGRALVVLSCVVAAACSDASGEGPIVSREVVGDTTIVRIAGAAEPDAAVEDLRIGELDGADEYTFGSITGMAVADDGTIFVLDQQALVIRVYDAAGAHIRTFARSGEGPGELKQPYGMLFLSDGRLVVRDPGNARMSLYSRTGEALTTWPIPGGYFTSAPIYSDDAGNVYTDIIAERRGDGTWKLGLLRLNRDGETVDTLQRPFADYSPPSVRAERVSGSNRSMTMSGVPFWPQAVIALDRSGHFVGGIADRYAVTSWRANGSVLRIERDVPPVAVDPAEADAAMERITRNMRRLDENWRWDGPKPPATKPAFTEIHVAEDDRIWVRLSQPAVRQPPEPDAEPDDRGRMPVDVWIAPTVYEIFESTGDYVATVTLSDRFSPMVLRGEFAWGVLRDEYDVQYVARYRVLGPGTRYSDRPDGA